MASRIMAHLVAFYPDREGSLQTALALSDGGASYLEIQFPFSDPVADGTFIQHACRCALEEGFRVRGGFELVGAVRKRCGIPIFIMGYANTVFFHGVQTFLGAAVSSGACGVIVPDLPPDCDEGLFDAAARANVHAVPVIAPSIEEERLAQVLSCPSEFVYAALRKGITGAYTQIGDENVRFLEKVGRNGKKIFAGFGISERSQVDALSPHVHACVVGSAFIREITGRGQTSVYDAVRRRMETLSGSTASASPPSGTTPS